MMEQIVLWGGGGHGRVVADLVRRLGGSIVGVADAGPTGVHLGGFGPGVQLLSETDLLEEFAGRRAPAGVQSVALGLGDNAARWRAFSALPPAACPPLVHPSAYLADTVTIGPGSVVLAGAVINAGARIGSAVIINTGAIVEHDAMVGDGVHVSPGAVLCGMVVVEPLAWIGAGATVIPGVEIGRSAVVGAGSVVLRPVPADAVVAGVPARPIQAPAEPR